MPSLTRIFGWAPSKNEAYIDVVPRQPHAQQNPTFHISEPISSRRSVSSHSSVMFEETSPSSSTSSLCPDSELVEKKPDISRRGDPSWVARPRNAFLIFRCQYSRENCKPGRRVRRPPGSQPEKTLSKRAAEAWHQLPAEEKERYKVLAEEEGKEHARLHPDYRFRPMRRPGGQRRSTRSVSARGPTTSDAPSSHPPRQRGTSPNSLADLPQSLLGSYASKASRRRSVSVPVPLDQQPHIVPSDVDFQPQLSKLLQRRSKSMTEGWMSLQIPASSSRLWSDECLSPWDEPPHPSRVYDPESPYSSGFASPGIHFPDFSTPEYSPIEATSGLASSSSSLLNWNGEYTSRGPGLQPLNLSQYPSPLSPLHGVEFDLNALSQLPEFAHPCESQLTGEQPGYHVSDETWMSQMSQYVPSSGMHVPVGTSDMDMDTIADSTLVHDSNGGYNGIQAYGMTDSLSGGILANEIRAHDSLFLAENNSYYPAY